LIDVHYSHARGKQIALPKHENFIEHLFNITIYIKNIMSFFLSLSLFLYLTLPLQKFKIKHIIYLLRYVSEYKLKISFIKKGSTCVVTERKMSCVLRTETREVLEFIRYTSHSLFVVLIRSQTWTRYVESNRTWNLEFTQTISHVSVVSPSASRSHTYIYLQHVMRK